MTGEIKEVLKRLFLEAENLTTLLVPYKVEIQKVVRKNFDELSISEKIRVANLIVSSNDQE